MQQDKHFQFSKILTITCILLAIAGCASAIIFPIPEMVAVALVTVSGGIVATSVVWLLKKSQSENVLKIYLSAYERILDLKHQYNNDENCIELENRIINKIDQTFDETIDDATSLIEKQEVQI